MKKAGKPQPLFVEEHMQEQFDKFTAEENYEALEGMTLAWNQYVNEEQIEAMENFAEGKEIKVPNEDFLELVDDDIPFPDDLGGAFLPPVENELHDLQDATCDEIFAHVQNYFEDIISIEESIKMIKLALLRYGEGRNELGN